MPVESRAANISAHNDIWIGELLDMFIRLRRMFIHSSVNEISREEITCCLICR